MKFKKSILNLLAAAALLPSIVGSLMRIDRRDFLSTLLIAAFCTLGTTSAKAAVIDFSSIGCTTGFFQELPSPLTFSGFTFATSNDVFQFATNCADAPDSYPGSAALTLASWSNTITMTHDGGGAFALNSMLFAQMITNHTNPGPINAPGLVTFYGTTAIGTQVTQSFNFGSANGGPTFERLDFSPAFQDVVSVQWGNDRADFGNNDYFQFDDVSVTALVTAVPEPDTRALLAFGCVFLFGAARWHRAGGFGGQV